MRDNEKKYTERELIEAKREGFSVGSDWRSACGRTGRLFSDDCYGNVEGVAAYEREAAERHFPLTRKVTKPRKVTLSNGLTYYIEKQSLYVVGYNSKSSFNSLLPSSFHATATADDFEKLADLKRNPTECVEEAVC